MKKIFLSLTCLAFLAACSNPETSGANNSEETVANSESANDPENAPVFKFEKEAYDFGTITEGQTVTYDFKFRNTGKSPMIISSATATCGCTVPDYPKQPIAPGEEGIIKVLFNSTGKPGMQNKVITITANTVPEITELNILGNVTAAAKN